MKKIATIIYPFEQVEEIVGYSLNLAQTLELQPVFVSLTDAEETAADRELRNTSERFDQSVVQEDRKKILRRILLGCGFEVQFVDRIVDSFVTGNIQKVASAINSMTEIDFVFLTRPETQQYQFPASNFLSLISKPLAIFPLAVDFHQIKTILYVASFEEKDISFLKYLAQLATQINASITVCHLSRHPGDEAELKLSGYQALLKSQIDFLNIQILQEKSDLSDCALNQFCGKYYADMLVIPGDDFGFFLEKFSIATPEQFVAQNQLPFAVFGGYPEKLNGAGI